MEVRYYKRRALLNVPGDDMKKIDKAITIPVDTVVLDLEDGVAPSKKALARANIVQALSSAHSLIWQQSSIKGQEVVIRMNSINSGKC